jgi:uncharacterized protein (TIGR04222 family)
MRQQGWSREYCLRAIDDYKKFVFLAVVAGHQVVPSDQVDQVWHLHILYSESYWEDFCSNVLGRKLQHCPARGGGQERATFHYLYRATIDSYRQYFGEPPLDLWPPADIRFGSDLQRQRIHIGRRPGLRQFLPALSLLAVCTVVSASLARATSSTASATSATDDLQAMLLLLLAMAVGLVIRRLIRRPDTQATSPLLSAEQLAYLARGATGALDVALAQLVDRGALLPNRDKKTLNLTFFVSPCVSPLEQQVVRRNKQLAQIPYELPTYENLVTPGAYDYSSLKQDLREKGLMIGPLSLAASRSFYWLLIPLIVPSAMNMMGLPFPSEFRHAFDSGLVGPWTLTLVCSAFLIIPGGRTRWGSSVLGYHQKHGDAHDPMIRVALLGPTALSGGRLDDLRLLIEQIKREREQSCGAGC